VVSVERGLLHPFVSASQNQLYHSALFLADQLRKDGKLPPIGGLLSSPQDPTLRLSDGRLVPSLAFGTYKVPAGAEGVKIISEAIQAGYRHFDSASVYNNEAELGQAIRQSGVPREDFFICSKVWNDAQKEGAQAVRKSVETSLRNLCCGYIDVMYVHWPVPGHFAETYKVIQEFHAGGRVRNIGISNFGIAEYEELMEADGVTIPPAVNQIEISPLMYRAKTIQYFQDRGIVMVASKALNRASGTDHGVVPSIAARHSATPAQVLLRWGIQKGLVVLSKTSNPQRMAENRGALALDLTEEDIEKLDALTSEEEIRAREELEIVRRNGI
jgi:diketogulonate reductase-like aldo/keto reductase